MKTDQRLNQVKHFVDHVYPGATIIQRSAMRAFQSGVMFKVVPQEIDIDSSGAYLYLVRNLSNGTLYWGISWKTADGHSKAGTTLVDDLYSGSPTDSEYRVMREAQSAKDFMMVIVAMFDTPEGYADWDQADKKKWLSENLGAAERHAIARSRESFGDYADGGLTLNVSNGGVNGGDITGQTRSAETRAKISANNANRGKFGVDHNRSKAVIELVSGSVFDGGHDAYRQTGISQNTISKSCTRNRQKFLDGNKLTVSSRRGNPNFGKCWMLVSDLQEFTSRGDCVEVYQNTGLGDGHPNDRAVIEMVSGECYRSATEASEQLGIVRSSISFSCKRSRDRFIAGKQLIASNRLTRHGNPNPNFGRCWIYLDDMQEFLNSGKSVEVHHPTP